jgi:hypothetical protein
MKISVLGYPWEIKVLGEAEFVKSTKRMKTEGCAAFTSISDRQIFLMEKNITKQIVIHEFTHAFYSYLCIESAELSPLQQEEVFCEMMATHGETVLKLSNKVLRRLK